MTLEVTYEGTFGTTDVSGIAVTADGEVLTIDIAKTVLRFTPTGTFVSIFDTPNGWTARGIAAAADGDIWLSNYWGGPNEFGYEGPRLYRVSSAGALEAELYDADFPDSPVEYPGQVAVGPDGDVYVCSNFYRASPALYTSQVYRLGSDGSFEETIGEPAPPTGGSPPFAEPQEPGELVHPVGVAVDADGNVFVADCYKPYKTITKFGPTGEVVTSFGGVGDGPGQFASGGLSDFGYYWDGMQLAVDAAGRVFATDQWGQKVNVYDNDGTYLGALTNADTGTDAMPNPFGIACGVDGNVYVGNATNRSATRWTVAAAAALTVRGVTATVCGEAGC